MNQTWIKYLPDFLREKVEDQEALQRVVGNAAWQCADHVLRLGVGLVVGIWVARYLGPEQFGLLSYAIAFATLFSAIASLGLDDIIVRDVVKDRGAKGEILGTAFVLKLAAGTLGFLTAVVSISFLRPDDDLGRWMVTIIAFGVILQAFNTIEFWFHSQVQAKYIVFANNVAFFVATAVKVGLILAQAPLIAFAWVALFEVTIVAGGLIFAYLYMGNRMSEWRSTLKQASGLLRDSWPLMLAGIVIIVYLRIDQIMLGEMVGNEEVGIYAVAVRLTEVWVFIPSAIYWSVLTSIVEAKAESEELFYGRLQRLYNLMALSTYAVALPVTFLAQWLVPLLFGEAYARAGLMLAVLVWSNLFTSLGMARSGFLTTMNWTRLYLATSALGCLLNIALNLWLIPLYGGMGAVIATLVAYWFAAHGSCLLFTPLHRTGRMLTRALVWPKIW